ncbi:unnamed protein product [Pleuronectes platessa]|uniref:Uncharacterized protein n=1 Tax=Pleuronectes platessa TaxID=8262 RepID=A0A9N7VGX9_PLEPL|nr:unnamed protein product [Pleuronectes platessa]
MKHKELWLWIREETVGHMMLHHLWKEPDERQRSILESGIKHEDGSSDGVLSDIITQEVNYFSQSFSTGSGQKGNDRAIVRAADRMFAPTPASSPSAPADEWRETDAAFRFPVHHFLSNLHCV